MSDAKPTFDEMLHTVHIRWADVEQRLSDAINLVRQCPTPRWFLAVQLEMLREDVAKWRQEAKEDYEAF